MCSVETRVSPVSRAPPPRRLLDSGREPCTVQGHSSVGSVRLARALSGGTMSISGIRSAVTQRRVYVGVSLVVGAMLAGHVLANEFNSQSGEQLDMNRLGHVDLQFRDAYQPNVIVY